MNFPVLPDVSRVLTSEPVVPVAEPDWNDGHHRGKTMTQDHTTVEVGPQQIESLRSYYDELAGFDWNYAWSDDHRVWQRGSDRNRELSRKRDLSPEHDALYRAMQAWGDNRADKPARP